MRNRSYQNAWRRRSRGVSQVLHDVEKKRGDPSQLELNFCAEPWRPLAAIAVAATLVDRPMTEEELEAEFKRLFP